MFIRFYKPIFNFNGTLIDFKLTEPIKLRVFKPSNELDDDEYIYNSFINKFNSLNINKK